MSVFREWVGGKWQQIDNGSQVVGGLGGQLLGEKILTSDVTSVDFNYLNSLVDGDYTLEIRANTAGASDYGILLYVNGVTTGYTTKWSEQHKTGQNIANFAFAQVGVLLSKTTTNSTSISTVKITIQSGRVSFSAYGGFERNSNVYYGTFNSSGSLAATQSSITSIQVGGGGTFSSGSTFRLYGSTINSINNSPINLTGATTDLLLKVGQTAYINYTTATSVPLHIQTEEGLYELKLIGDTTRTQVGNTPSVLLPNNTTTTGATDIKMAQSGKGMDGTNAVGWDNSWAINIITMADGVVAKVSAEISTFTKAKTYQSRVISRWDANFQLRQQDAYWNDTTTVWSSLGTITFPFTQSGKIVIKRII
jgi:hypothetical protein